jgi:hypothetical protein
VYGNFVAHQTRLLAEFRRLATEHAFITVDARGSIPQVFRSLCEIIDPVVRDMATSGAMVVTEHAEVASTRPQLPSS